MATNQLLKPHDVAIALNVSRSFAYFLIRTGQIPSVRIGQSAVRVRPEDLDAYIKKNISGDTHPIIEFLKSENTTSRFKGMIL